ncbi:hypothetical protein [Streptomyces chartreusis]
MQSPVLFLPYPHPVTEQDGMVPYLRIWAAVLAANFSLSGRPSAFHR